MKTLVRWLNYIGLYTRSQVMAEIAKTEPEINNTEKKVNIYDFGALIKVYNKRQLNAFVYEAIRITSTDKEKRELLDWWQKRIVMVLSKNKTK